MKKIIIINISILSVLFYIKLSNDYLNISQLIYSKKELFFNRSSEYLAYIFPKAESEDGDMFTQPIDYRQDTEYGTQIAQNSDDGAGLASEGPIFPYIDSKEPSGISFAESTTAKNFFTRERALPPFAAKAPSIEEPKEKKQNPYPLPKRIAISHNEGWGSRFHELRSNYSLLELLLAPDARQKRFLTMFDFRGYRFDSGNYAFSSGIVGRYVPSQNNFCELLGINAYYDYQETSCGYSNQVGVGGEVLGKRWDFRANVYVPFGNRRGFSYCHPKCLNGWFGLGYNAEVGYLAIRSKSFLLYTALGPYYITVHDCDERKVGGMLRIVPQYKDYLALNMKFSYDSVFKGMLQAELIISLPLYQVSVREKGPCGITNRQIYQRVERRF